MQVSRSPKRLVQQHRRDRRIDAARQAANDAALADLAAQPRDRVVAEGRHAPIAAAARDLVREILDERRALRRVHDLGMEHQAIEFAAIVGDGGEGRALAGRDDAKAGRRLGDAVAMAHPHLLARALGPEALEEGALADHVDEGAAELAMVGRFDLAAQLRRHRHLPIADAEHGNAELEHLLRRARRTGLVHRRRSAREDDGLGREGAKPLGGHGEGMDLAIDTALAHAARDELRHLAAEIENEDSVGHGSASFPAGPAVASAAS